MFLVHFFEEYGISPLFSFSIYNINHFSSIQARHLCSLYKFQKTFLALRFKSERFVQTNKIVELWRILIQYNQDKHIANAQSFST